MFCSTIIPTVGRPSVSQAVESVLSQDFPPEEHEVIVVNDSGNPLPETGWRRDRRVLVIDTLCRERSIARNTGASAARGRFLHFLDDDDWLAPGALSHFRVLSQKRSGAWLYGISQLVDRQHRPILQLRHGVEGKCFVQVMAGEWIPLQASLIDARAFFRVGGFNPLISGPEDIDLLRRIALSGDLFETPNVVAFVVRGERGSTTDYRNHAAASRWARESILDTPGVFHALRSSAHNPFWRGRMARIYLTSCVWNLQHRRPLTAFSRIAFGLAAVLAAGSGIAFRDFWRAVAKPYHSETFQSERA